MSSSTPLPPPPGSMPERERLMSAEKAAAVTRRASLLLLILGSLVLLVAALCFSTLAIDPQILIDQFTASTPAAFREQWPQDQLRVIVRAEWVVAGMIALFMGLSLILSAGPIRRGRRGAVIYAIVVVVLCTLWCGLNVVVGLVLTLLGSFQAIPGMLLAACVLAACVACLIALFGTYKGASAALQRQRVSLQALRYPPGYASGYGAQVRAAPAPINIEQPRDSTPQTT